MPRQQRHLGYRIAATSLALIAFLTLIPHAEDSARAASTPLSCILCGDYGTVDFLLNVALFVPLGLGLALAGFSWRRAVVLAFLTTFGVELLQMKVIAGRDASLGDVLANTLGSGLGAALSAAWRSAVFPSAQLARRLSLAWALILVWVWAGTAWALGPAFPTGAAWFGGWAPEFSNYDQFMGRPLVVTAGGEPLLPGRALDQQRLEDALTARPQLAFRGILGPRPRGLAPIAVVVDGGHRTVMLLGQERQDLTYELSTRAAIVRLRSPRVNLRNGLDGSPGDTVDAEGALRDGAFELSSRTGDRVLSRRLPLSASWGWTLITPSGSVLGEEAHSLTAFWIVGLVAPLAYWSILAGGASVVIIPVAVTLMLAAIPAAAGFPPAHWSEWVAALVGILIGCFVAWRARGALHRSEPDPEDEEPPSSEATA